MVFMLIMLSDLLKRDELENMNNDLCATSILDIIRDMGDPTKLKVFNALDIPMVGARMRFPIE